MKTIVLDYETYYSSEYSLRKMTPVEYILDPRFEVIGCAVKDDDFARWYADDELREYLKTLPKKTIVVSHNALFDMCILSWRYNYRPHLMADTLGMARAWVGHKLNSLSLASLATYYGVGAKGNTVRSVEGMNLAAIKQAGLYSEYAQYSCNDADLCYTIYRKMITEGFPASEIAVMDTVLRCATQPRFVLDQNLLAEHLHNTVARKSDLLARCGLSSRDELMSNDKFAEALRKLGVEPPTKISPTTGKETYAFAKTDSAFIELDEHENPEVQALVAARLGVKSTLEESRTQRLMTIGNLTWPGNKQGLMPIPLRFSGAHTHRLSGDWKLNMQNLPRGGNLRKALRAPPGYRVVTVDAAQIEARMAGWFAGATALTSAFANKEDVYSSFASKVFGRPINKKEHPVERFIGKTAVLGLQYGLGWPKFQKTVKIQSKIQLGQEISLSDEEAANVIKTYRTLYYQIPAMWNRLTTLLPRMTSPDLFEMQFPVTFEHERIRLPSGLYLNYHDLENRGGQWWFTFAGKPKYIYGGKLLENITQALARIHVMDAAVRVRKRLKSLGLAEEVLEPNLALQAHDELAYIAHEEIEAMVLSIVLEEMRRPPAWGTDIPLDAEGGCGASYGDAK
jgi:DNA polymerase